MAALAARQWGVVSTREARTRGLSADAISTRVAKGWLHPLYRGVLAVGHPRPPLEGLFLAAVKACGPFAVLSHYAAAALLRFVVWDGRHPEVTVPGTGTRVHPGLRVHRTAQLEPADVLWHGPIPLTAPARTLVDLASVLTPRRLRRAVRQAQSVGSLNLGELVLTMNRLGRRRGCVALRRIIATGPAPTRSELEDVVLDLILGGGLEHPEVNRPLRMDGRKVVPDFRWPARRLVVEADGAAWHDNRLAREDDAERQALLEARGERVVRVTWEQAVKRPAETLARVRAAGAPTAT